MAQPIDIIQGGRESWLAHAYTKAQRAKSRAMQELALKRLLSICADSNDPTVLRAYHAWAVQERTLLLLGEATEGKENAAL
jgi:hypothetical protein